jgi:UDP-N-acetylmuramoyl-L-alanyl-D-glutamate--2,6-diaminopimelate ligase
MEDYLNAKLKLFEKIKKGGFVIINTDDSSAAKIIEKVKSGAKAKIITYGIDREADVTAEDIKLSCNGLKFKLGIAERVFASSASIEIKSNLIGRYNIYNILASIAAAIAMGMDLKDIEKGIEDMRGLPGRLERVDCGQNFSVYVDYAHTEDGLENVLKSLRELKQGKLIVVFGCGGNRDKSKRSRMGKISTELSDKVFITSDNPRNEEPMDIINEIIKDICPDKNNYAIESDRFNAIKKALTEAREGDIVLVAGKGHETYQIFKDTTVPFDDREVVKRVLKEAGLCLQ